MDPISGLLLACVLVVLGGKVVGGAVTDVVAQARGKTPPSLEKWRKRQEMRAARGEAPEKDPGPWRRRWRNAVEERAIKAALKHQARMEYLAEAGDDIVARHKDRLHRRARRWEQINAKCAEWGSTSWEATKAAAAAARDAYDERRAWKENERRNQPDPQTPDDEAPHQDDVDPGSGAQVLPFRPIDRPEPEPVPNPSDIQQSGASVSTPSSTPTPSSTEITDLDTAISYSAETAKYTDTVGSTLADVTAQIDAAMQGLAAEAAAYEQAKASLADEGFGAKITSRFDIAAEALNLAAEALKAAGERVSTASEQVTTAGGEMRATVNIFNEQLSVSETVGAARQDAGVSKRTDFYAPA